MTGPFTRYCPNGKTDEHYAHDISDSFTSEGGLSERFLYCRRCGQAVPVRDAMEVTAHSVRSEPVRDA